MAKANQANYEGIDPLDGRYFDAEVAAVLSERAAIAYQAQVEAALAETLAEFKICSSSIAKEIVQATSKVSVEEVYKEEAITKHNVKALVNCIKRRVSANAKPFVHFSATSYDIISTAQALQYQAAVKKIILPRLKTLLAVLITKSNKYAAVTQVGRTHGQHALPITFGFALSEYVSRLGQSSLAVSALIGELVGKFSGAVGAANALAVFVPDPLKFELRLLGRLGLKPAEYSTQIAPPDTLIRLFDELTIAAGIMANLATDMRHLQRSEIAEVREQFEASQTGSSTMAHKRNPVSFENVASLNKQVLAQQLAAQLNLVSEHQRDLTDSASSRFYPVLVACVAEMSRRLSGAMEKLEVDEAALQKNLALSGGAIAAEPLYLLLSQHGLGDAHEVAKKLAHQAQASGQTLAEVVASNNRTKPYWQKFSQKQKRIITNPEKYYTGLAAVKSRAIAASWKSQLTKLK